MVKSNFPTCVTLLFISLQIGRHTTSQFEFGNHGYENFLGAANNMERYHEPFNGYQISRRKTIYTPETINNVELETTAFKPDEEFGPQISEHRIYSRLPDSSELEYEDKTQLNRPGFQGNLLANRENSFHNSPTYSFSGDESNIYPNYDIERDNVPFTDQVIDRGESYGDSPIEMNDYEFQDENPGMGGYENKGKDQEETQNDEMYVRRYHNTYRPYFRRLQLNDGVIFDSGNQLSPPLKNVEVNARKNPSGSLKNKHLKLILLNADSPSDSKSIDGIHSMLLEDKLHNRFLVPAYTIETSQAKGSGNKKILIVINEDLLRNGILSSPDQIQRKFTEVDENRFDKQRRPTEDDEDEYHSMIEKNQTLEYMPSLFDNAIDILAALQMQSLRNSQQPKDPFSADTSIGGNRNFNDNQNLMDLMKNFYLSQSQPNSVNYERTPVLEEEKGTVPGVFSQAYESDNFKIKNQPEMLAVLKSLYEATLKRLMSKTNENFVGGLSRPNVLNFPYAISDAQRKTSQQPQETKASISSKPNEKESSTIPKYKHSIIPGDTEYDYDTKFNEKLKLTDGLNKKLFLTNNQKQNYYPISRNPSSSSSNFGKLDLDVERPKTPQSDRAPTYSRRAEQKNLKYQSPEEPQFRRAQPDQTKDVSQRSPEPTEDDKKVIILITELLRKSFGGQHSIPASLFEPIFEAAKANAPQDFDRFVLEKSKKLSYPLEKLQPSKVGVISRKEMFQPNNIKPILSKLFKMNVAPKSENIVFDMPKGSRGSVYDSNPSLSEFHVMPIEVKDISPQSIYPYSISPYKKYLNYMLSTDDEVNQEPTKMYNPVNAAAFFNPDTDTNVQDVTRSVAHFPAAFFVKHNLKMPVLSRGMPLQFPWNIIQSPASSVRSIPISTLSTPETSMLYPITSPVNYHLDFNGIDGDGNQMLHSMSEDVDFSPLFEVIISLCRSIKNMVK